MNGSAPPAFNDPAWNDFLVSGVSIVVAARNAGNFPSLMRAVGGRFDAEQGRFTFFLCISRSRELLDDIRRNGMVAVVISKPTTHQTVQIKSDSARVDTLRTGDFEIIRSYVQGMVAELEQLRFPASFTHLLMEYDLSDMASVSFVPSSAFLQTPGPSAGTSLSLAP